MLLDEWPDVAEVLGAVKRSGDADSHAGRFVLTGSVSGQLDAVSWPGTGRLVRLEMFGLTMRERQGRVGGRPSVEELLRGDVRLPTDRPNLVDYVDLALIGGFPTSSVWPTPPTVGCGSTATSTNSSPVTSAASAVVVTPSVSAGISRRGR